MEYKGNVLQKLNAMGDYFCKLVEDDNVKFANKIRAAQLSLKCYAEVLKSESTEEKIVDAVTFFLTGVTEKILRSELYMQYLKYCIIKKIEPDSKTGFYEKVRKLQFEEKRSSGGRFFLPPSSD